MLGGDDAGQPLFELTTQEDQAMERVLARKGVGRMGTANDEARATWRNYTPGERIEIIRDSLRAAKVPDVVIDEMMPYILDRSSAGDNNATYNRASTKGRVITRAMMNNAVKSGKAILPQLPALTGRIPTGVTFGRLGASLGGTIIFGGVGYA